MADTARYHRISPKIWRHAHNHNWDQDTVLLVLFLFTCPERGKRMSYAITNDLIQKYLDWSDQRIVAASIPLAEQDIVAQIPYGFQVIIPEHISPLDGRWRQPAANIPEWKKRRLSWVSVRRRMSPLVFARDGRQCAQCGTDEDLQIDHIVPLAHGGSNNMDNLQVLCGPCNYAKGPRRGRKGRTDGT